MPLLFTTDASINRLKIVLWNKIVVVNFTESDCHTGNLNKVFVKIIAHIKNERSSGESYKDFITLLRLKGNLQC